MRALLVSLVLLATAGTAAADQELPIFDAHMHYSHDAWEVVPPKQVVEILKKAGVKRAMVVGGGNTALDIAHELALLGVEVDMVYRRSEKEMGGYVHELDGARLDGVRLVENRQPVEIVRKDGQVVGVKLATTRDGKPVPGTEELVPVELVCMAIGQERATGVARAFPGVELDSRGRVKVDASTHRTGPPVPLLRASPTLRTMTRCRRPGRRTQRSRPAWPHRCREGWDTEEGAARSAPRSG